jgi:hypothetical protein
MFQKNSIDPLPVDDNAVESQQLEAVCMMTLEEKQIGYSPIIDAGDSDDSDWERSAFDAFEDTTQ